MITIALLAAVTALVAGALAPGMRRLGFAVGAVDRPGHRRVHSGEVSRLGGVAVWSAVALVATSAALGGVLDDHAFVHARVTWSWLALGAVVLVAIGIVDDMGGVSARMKLVAQCLAAGCVVAGDCVVQEATNPFTGGSIMLGAFAIPATVLWVVGVTNALNLIDGLDGLAAGVGLIVASTLSLISFSIGRPDVAMLGGILAGALVGFLYFNFNPATIFLGDSGSLFLGYTLAVLAIEAAHKGTTAVLVMAPILALGVPLMDTVLAVVRRMLVSASIMTPDRDHIHHRLIALGLSHRRAVMVLYGACLVLNVAAIMTLRAASRETALIAVAVALGTFLGVRKLRYHELPQLPGFARFGPHALLAIADAVCLIVAYAAAVYALHGGVLPSGATLDVARAATVAGVLELAVLLLSDVYRDQPDRVGWRRWAALAVALLAGAVTASIGLFVTRASHYHDPATLALDVVLAAALLALMRGAAHARRWMMRTPEVTIVTSATQVATGRRADPGRRAA